MYAVYEKTVVKDKYMDVMPSTFRVFLECILPDTENTSYAIRRTYKNPFLTYSALQYDVPSALHIVNTYPCQSYVMSGPYHEQEHRREDKTCSKENTKGTLKQLVGYTTLGNTK